MHEKKRTCKQFRVVIPRRGLAQQKIRRIILLTAVTFVSLSMAIGAFADRAEQRKVVAIDLRGRSEAQIRQLLKVYPDLGAGAHKNGRLEAVVTTEELKKIELQGYPIKILIDDTKVYSEDLRAKGYFDDFHSYEQTVASMKAAQERYPHLAKLYDIGDSWEKTAGIADRDIWAMKVSDNVAEQEDEPEVLYMGLHHAREIITPEIVLHWMNFLLRNYGKSSLVTYCTLLSQLWQPFSLPLTIRLSFP